jgi:leader peptidase (prepilin peptidase)/N-methyltransferase
MGQLPAEPGFVLSVALVLGLVVGSFLNVVIYRLPAGLSVVLPASHCPACSKPIAARDNVPVLAWLWLRGRCRHCGAKISFRYPAVELFTGCVFAALAWRFGVSFTTPVYMLFAAGLIAAACIDFDHQIIPDSISLGGLVIGVSLLPAARAAQGVGYAAALHESLLGAVLGGGLLWSVGFLHARVSVALGREFEHWPGEGGAAPRPSQADYWLWFPGLGLGDVKLLAMIGAFVGPAGVLLTILAASFIGLAMGLVFAVMTRSWDSPFGFGPAIAVGAGIALFLQAGVGLPVAFG